MSSKKTKNQNSPLYSKLPAEGILLLDTIMDALTSGELPMPNHEDYSKNKGTPWETPGAFKKFMKKQIKKKSKR